MAYPSEDGLFEVLQAFDASLWVKVGRPLLSIQWVISLDIGSRRQFSLETEQGQLLYFVHTQKKYTLAIHLFIEGL